MSKDSTRKFAIGAAIAAGAGYVVGLLTAPKSGKDTRQDIRNSAAKGVAEAEKQLEKAQDELKSLLDSASGKSAKLSNAAKAELQDILDKADDARYKTREVLAALRKGKADDKELQRALDEAKTAIKHLRNYLSK